MLRTKLFVSVITILVTVSGERLYSTSKPAVKSPAAAAAPIDPNRYSADQNLTFTVSARGLPSADIVGKVDPYFKVYSNSKEKAEFEKFGTSDVVSDSPDPDFNQIFWFVHKTGTEQRWRFKLRDQDSLRPDNPLGEAEFAVDEYVAKGQKLEVKLDLGGTLLVQKTTPLRFKLYARNLPSLDTIGKSDPFIKMYWKRGSKGDDIEFAKTSVKENEENPDWDDEIIEFPNYIKGTDQWWSFKVRDHDGVGSDDELGEALVEIDRYLEKRETKILKIGKDGKSQLAITPV